MYCFMNTSVEAFVGGAGDLVYRHYDRRLQCYDLIQSPEPSLLGFRWRDGGWRAIRREGFAEQSPKTGFVCDSGLSRRRYFGGGGTGQLPS
jgi:hypothetical protein